MKLSLHKNLIIVGSLILITIMTLIGLGYVGKIHYEENNWMQQQLSAIQILSLENRRREKDFFLRGKLKYRDKLVQNVQTILNHTQMIKQSGISQSTNESLLKVEALIQSYSDQFENVVKLYLKKGLDASLGVRGELREAIHHVEAILKALEKDNPDLTFEITQLKVQLLTLRRREKDFIIRSDTKYVRLFNKDYTIFEKSLEDLDLPLSEEKEILSLSRRYRDNFIHLTTLEGEINVRIDEFRNVVHQVEPEIKQMLMQIQQEKRVEFEKIKQLTLIIIIVSFFVILLLLWALSRSSMHVLDRFIGLFEQIEQGDLNACYPENEISTHDIAHDPISLLATKFNAFMNDIRLFVHKVDELGQAKLHSDVFEYLGKPHLDSLIHNLRTSMKELSLGNEVQGNLSGTEVNGRNIDVLRKVVAANTSLVLSSLAQRASEIEYELFADIHLTSEKTAERTASLHELENILTGLASQSRLLSDLTENQPEKSQQPRSKKLAIDDTDDD